VNVNITRLLESEDFRQLSTPGLPRALSQGGIGFFVEEVQNIHRLLKSSNAIIHTPPTSSSIQPPMLPPSPLPGPTPSSSIQPIDAPPNPRFVSHLPPIFTKQLAREHELREVHRRSEAESVENSTKLKQGV